jgi:membrane protein YqaA with SNARE-associated domain
MRKRIGLYHSILKRKGIYTLAWKSVLRLIVIAAIIGVVLYVAQLYIVDFKEVVNEFLQKWNPPFVLSLFYLSETLLGLIPPDFFIVWSSTTSSPIIMLTVLALLSYLGGISAYFIGNRIAKFPRVNKWLKFKFSSHFATLHKYGGFLIVFSALFPLPFSTITMVAGILDYPFKKLSLLGLTRLLRFFIYAAVLYRVFD